jgi:lactose/L-arabinose transport system ATP-binding protein
MADVQLRDVRKSFGKVETIHGVNLDIRDKEFVVFVGPSGCGKSTLLRLIAGLEDITAGDLKIDGVRMNALPPAKRGIAMVFQSYALYPHMTVYENMAFGLELAKTGKDAIDKAVRHAADILELTPLLDRKPAALSGGQRQRVAIGRAIVRGPEVFLFDEPLSNLDAELRVEMRVEIARLHREIGATMIYVTHDQVEAMTLADKIVVLRSGRVEQVGRPLDLYHDPDNRFVAGFIGSPAMNFVAATVENGALRAPGLGEAPVPTAAALPGAGAKVSVGLRPQHLTLDPAGSTHRVEITEALGGVSYIHLSSASGEKLVVESREDPKVAPGARAGVAFNPADAMVFSETGARLR